MLHEETVERETLALIRKLTADEVLKDFVLVGGTALSLQLGHRKSIDIDLFTPKAFDTTSIGGHVESAYNGERVTVVGNAVFSKIDGVKTDMIAHRYAWIKPVQQMEGIRMASMEDIAAMKLHAIVNSGRRLKDYVDVHFLLEHKSLGELTAFYTDKYPDTNEAMAKNALLYHKEINFRADLSLMNWEFSWGEVKKRLRAAVIEPNKVFKGRKSIVQDDLVKGDAEVTQKKRKGRRI